MSAGEPGRQNTLANPIIWRHFNQWIEDNLKPEWGIDDIPLEEIRKDYSDLTLPEAKSQACKDERIAAKLILEEECPVENPLLERFEEDVITARGVGISDQQIINVLRNVGLELERPTSAGLAKAKRQIEDLTKEREGLKAELKKVLDAKHPPALTTPEVLDELYTEFERAFQTRLGRIPKIGEYTHFVSCVEAAPNVDAAKSECKRLVELLAPPAVVKEVKAPEPVPGWYEHWAIKAKYNIEEKKRLAERPPPSPAPIILQVENLKTGSVQRVKFWSTESKERFIKILDKIYTYTVMKDELGGS